MIRLLTLENANCRVQVAPEVGGRLTSLLLRRAGGDEELLWRNQALPLRRCAPGAAYDPEFYGGVDELLPCDAAETIDGIDCHDHGELWTTPLQAEQDAGGIRLHGTLPRFGLHYERRLRLAADRAELICDYRLANPTATQRHFMWKLHAAVAARPGDHLVCPARQAQALDLAYSTCPSHDPFAWPRCGVVDKSLVPPVAGTCEFLGLSGLDEGRMGWISPARNLAVTWHFDLAVFPYAVLFQSSGGLAGHVTSVLEPSNSLCLSVAESIRRGQGGCLAPGQELTTTIRICCGPAASLENTP